VAGTTVIQRPSVEIFSPAEGQKVKGNLTVSGAAGGGTLGAAAVQVRVDSGEWVNASGTRSWQLTLDTRGLQNGAHTIEIRAYDGSGYSDPVTRTVNVDNTAPSRTVKKENTFTVLDWLILAIFVLVIIALVYLRRKK
jgi:hypothetical protein